MVAVKIIISVKERIFFFTLKYLIQNFSHDAPKIILF